MSRRKYPNWLKKNRILKHKDKLTIRQMMEKYDTTERYVTHVLKGHRHLIVPRLFATKQQLHDDYVINNHTRAYLAYKYGYKTTNSVAQALLRYGLKRRKYK